MSDNQLDWYNNAPTQDPGPFEAEAWNTDGVVDAALQIDGVKQVKSGVDGAAGLVSDAQSVGTLTDWDSVTGLVSSLEGNISAISNAASGFQEALAKLKANPVEWLAGSIVDFLMNAFQPLQDLVGMVTGNESRMQTSAQMWDTVQVGCSQVGEYVKTTGLDGVTNWQGADADAARVRIEETGMAIQNMGFVAMGLKYLLEIMAKVAKALYDEVIDLLKQGVTWVIERVVPYLTASFFTFGAASSIAIVDTIRKVAQLVMRAVDRIDKAIGIYEKVQRAIQIVQNIIEKLKPVIEFLQKAKAVYDSGMAVYEGGKAMWEGGNQVVDGVGQIADGNYTAGLNTTLGGASTAVGGASKTAGGVGGVAGGVNDMTGGNSSVLQGVEGAANTAKGAADSVGGVVDPAAKFVKDHENDLQTTEDAVHNYT